MCQFYLPPASGDVDDFAQICSFWGGKFTEMMMGIGARIAELRREKGESLQDVASAVGVTKTHIWELERGRAQNPSLNVISGLADHFGVSVASLVGEDIDADDPKQKIGRMFRLASDLDPKELETIDDMIEAFIRRKKERAADRS